MVGSTDYKILVRLFDKGELNYRSICDGRIHPKIARDHLDDLVKKGFVNEKGRENWKRGKELLYSLTRKGADYLAEITVKDFNSMLQRINRIATTYLNNPTKLQRQIITAWKASLVRPFEIESSEWQKADDYEKEYLRTKSYTSKEIDEELNRVEAIFTPLLECLKNIYKLFLIVDYTDLYSKIDGNPDGPYEIYQVLLGFTRAGNPYFRTIWKLKAAGIYIPESSF